MLAVEILMQAIIVAGAILQQQRRRTCLAGLVAAFEKRLMRLGITDMDPHRPVPTVSDGMELRIERRPQFSDQIRSG